MKNLTRILSVVVISSLMLVLAFTVNAQETTPEPTPDDTEGQMFPIICDSSLILLAGLAQRDYGYIPSTDLNEFEQGQYGHLYNFDDMDDMADMNQDEMGAEMTPEPEMTAPPEAPESAIFLPPPVVIDEDLRCTILRTEIEEFFSSDRFPQNAPDRGLNDNVNNNG